MPIARISGAGIDVQHPGYRITDPNMLVTGLNRHLLAGSVGQAPSAKRRGSRLALRNAAHRRGPGSGGIAEPGAIPAKRHPTPAYPTAGRVPDEVIRARIVQRRIEQVRLLGLERALLPDGDARCRHGTLLSDDQVRVGRREGADRDKRAASYLLAGKVEPHDGALAKRIILVPIGIHATRRQHVNGILAGPHVADDLIAAQFAGAHRFQAFGEILNRIGVHLGRRSGQAFLDRFLVIQADRMARPVGVVGAVVGKHRGDQPVARIVDIPRPRPKHAFVIRSRVTGGLRARIGARERRCQHIAVPKPELIRIRAHNGRAPHRHGAEQPGVAA